MEIPIFNALQVFLSLILLMYLLFVHHSLHRLLSTAVNATGKSIGARYGYGKLPRLHDQKRS